MGVTGAINVCHSLWVKRLILAGNHAILARSIRGYKLLSGWDRQVSNMYVRALAIGLAQKETT